MIYVLIRLKEKESLEQELFDEILVSKVTKKLISRFINTNIAISILF